MKVLLALCVAGCVSGGTPIGPYVKTVARNGDFLAILRCQIVLEGDDLREDTCAWEQIPLARLRPMPGPPGAR
ncbi:MAG: hypothetical protein QM831_01215 [Kofleriaceae bacterium]